LEEFSYLKGHPTLLPIQNGQSPVEETQAFLQEVARRSFVTAGESHIEPLASNPADTAVLQAAVEGQATHIVTGDKKHLLPLKEFQGIPILQPHDYLSRIHK
jgi:uncharacterized protein